MYLFDFKWFLSFILVAFLCALGSPLMAQQGPFPGVTKLSVPASPSRLSDFDFANLNGGTLKSSEMKGKVIVIRFWATW